MRFILGFIVGAVVYCALDKKQEADQKQAPKQPDNNQQ